MTEENETPIEEPRTYSQEEWDTLKNESIKNRKAASMADSLKTALRDALLREASAGLREPISWDDSFDGEDGLPSVEKITEAVEALKAEKPYLSKPAGDVGQGLRGDAAPQGVNLLEMMRG